MSETDDPIAAIGSLSETTVTGATSAPRERPLHRARDRAAVRARVTESCSSRGLGGLW